MALTPTLSNYAASAAVDQIGALLNAGGWCDLYDGAQPANPDVAVTTQVRLARLLLPDQAFNYPVTNGVGTMSDEFSAAAAVASGTASWCRFCNVEGDPVCDGSVGLAGCNINLDDVEIVVGEAVTVTSFTFTLPKVA